MATEEGLGVENRVIITQSKYSKRVVLKTILGRSDGGLGLIGETIVIGGWVKSSKEQTKDLPQPPKRTSTEKDVSCVEILQSRIPLFRSIFNVLSGSGGRPLRPKLDSVPATKPSLPEIAYLQVNDGSCVPNLQVVVHVSISPLSQLTPTGTSILVEGVLKQPSIPGKCVIELKVEKILHLGTVDYAEYPLSKRRLPLENLRNYSHLRPRTTTVGSVTRIRSSLTQATHAFFQSHEFLYVHTPIITSTDAKGSSEKFHVTTLIGKDEKEESNSMDDNRAIKLAVVKAAIKEKSSKIEELKRSDSNKEALDLALQDLQKANELALQLEARETSNSMDDNRDINLAVVKAAIEEKSSKIEELKRSDSNKQSLVLALQDLQKANELALQLEARETLNSGILSKSGNVDSSKDFFSHQMYLTVSGQLHLESYASALGSVYTFGPTFRAEKSKSTKNLAELWMVELEIAFADLEDVMSCAVDYLKFLCQWVLENCLEDMKFVSKRIDNTAIDRLQSMTSSSFEKITYKEAVELLNKVTDKTFEAKLEWGIALSEEHESYLADKMYGRPVIIYNYPKEIKPFFARLNDDGKTVATIDVIVPKVGTLIRGSQREERLEMLITRIKEFDLPREQYEWYLDLRRHGTVKHSGFNLAFDHMVLFATGLTNIKDAIPFPRSCSDTKY